MADIDDFFKKRDKKKKQTQKAKFSTLDTEEFAKQLETVSAVEGAAIVDGENSDAGVLNSEPSAAPTAAVTNHVSNQSSGVSENQDEEWKPFDSEDNKDYTGLRINQNWKLEDEEEEEDDADSNETDKKVAFTWGSSGKQKKQPQPDEDDQEKPTTDTPAVPAVAPVEPKPDETTKPAETTAPSATTNAPSEPQAYVPPYLRKQMEAAKSAPAAATPSAPANTPAPSTSAYIPPHLRNKGSDAGSTSTSSSTTVTSGRRKVQPNINDTFEFPTLAAAITTAPETGEKSTTGGDSSFVQSKKGARVEAKAKNPMIDLENKFTALETSNN